MKKENKSEYTIRATNKSLKYLSKHVDLDSPEQVKQFIASLQVSDSYKKNLCIAYNHYAKYYKIQWRMPIYKQEARARRRFLTT